MVRAEQIADQMGFTPRLVFQAERKRNISLERLGRMALGCDLVYAYGKCLLIFSYRSVSDFAEVV